jgi:hypothetical protein
VAHALQAAQSATNDMTLGALRIMHLLHAPPSAA